jgi:phosphoribosylaminoimidazolecarboxamide formyltransferase/IMP cyclohydrolase
MSEPRKIRRALISVSDKTGIVEFARELTDLGVEIVSTGGTAKSLRDAGFTVIEVSDVTGFPEMMDGRVKTLHPKIHGAFLALRDNREHVDAMQRHQIDPIDLVVVNLYPFEKTIAREGVSLDEAVENIDIGGPAMIRSASKNWRDVAVVTDPSAYKAIIAELKRSEGSLSLETRRELATAAYARTAAYDVAITEYLRRPVADEPDSLAPVTLALYLNKIADLRYGENPHQTAALYVTNEQGGVVRAVQFQGKEMSYNNYVDADAAWELVSDFDELAVAIIKHTNPSGVGLGPTTVEAYRRALSTDPVSAFGGIVAFNRTVDAVAAAAVNEVFTEVVLAPDYDAEALEIFKTRKNLRVLKVRPRDDRKQAELKQISGGFLRQERDVHNLAESDLRVVSEKQPSVDEIRALLFAWTVCKHVKSNAIVFANRTRTIGIGAGQMNRVDSVRIAAARAERFGLPLKGSVMASDAFFPFRDNIDEAAKYGVSAIIQPGGSVRDEECIAAANEHGISMVFTGIRHFKH